MRKGMWLPGDLWEMKLSWEERILYQDIRTLCSTFGQCTASDTYFGKLLQTSRKNTNYYVQKLKKKELISIYKLNESGKFKRIIKLTVQPNSDDLSEKGGNKILI